MTVPYSCPSCLAPLTLVVLSPGSRTTFVDDDPSPDGSVLADMSLQPPRGVDLSPMSLDVVRQETPDEPLYRIHRCSREGEG